MGNKGTIDKNHKQPAPVRYKEYDAPCEPDEAVCSPREMGERFMELIRWQQEIQLRLINSIGSITGNFPNHSEFPTSESHHMSLNLLEEITNSNLNLSSILKDLLQ